MPTPLAPVLVAAVAGVATVAAMAISAGPPPAPRVAAGVAPETTLVVDGAAGAGTGAVLLYPVDRPDAPFVVRPVRDGLELVDPDGGSVADTVTCGELGAVPRAGATLTPDTAGHVDSAGHVDTAGHLDSRSVVPVQRAHGPAVVAVALGGATSPCPTADPAVALVDVTDARTAWPTALVPRDDVVRSMASSPDGRTLVVADTELHDRSGWADIVDVAEPEEPRIVTGTPTGNGVAADDMAFSADGTVLYATAATHAVAIDMSDPATPVKLGQIADPLVRNYWRIESLTIDDPLLGTRELFVVRPRVDGLDCPTGMVHVYDITGELFEEPAMVADLDIPDELTTMHADQPLEGCPRAVVRLQAVDRTMTVGFGDNRVPWLERIPTGSRRTQAAVVPSAALPYDTTDAFRATLPRCTLVRTA
ncbi:hypothetical protein DVS28_a0896 [Euzebya pacifica]|uniref:Uncharacterized protein n=1 Tax=Euzebya pacifica TaxID=1608957 RepID=A0A346XTQ0_9ACTN|nr:hypothetical protein [Euzebya pacifica]AXV05597.1 hypothetical protein DVS28_a0896 [Euzebya pacifica]